ncbi:MAG: amino acid permease [Desulfurococcales archaeon]|nr:amino acid permease [Desulfurococcales archaeon]
MKSRKIGFPEAFAIGVGGMIGGGIFAVLGLSISISKYGAPIAFMVAGLVAIATGYSYAKLSVRYPSRGGTIEFVVKGFGSGVFSGGLNILLYLSYTVMIALYSFAFGHYAAAAFNAGYPWPQIFSVIVILAFTSVNALGAYVSGKVEDLLVYIKLSILLIVAGVGFLYVNYSKLSPGNWPSNINIIAGGMLIFVAYEGFELIANASQDVYDHRIIPKALYSSIIVTTLIYIGIAIVSVGVLPLSEVIKAKDYALAIVAKPVLGSAGFWLVIIGALLSTASAINATLYGTAGITYLISKIGYLPSELEKTLWKNASEGLFFIAIMSIILAVYAPLQTISVIGSLGFLTVFTSVNITAYRLRKEAKANPYIGLVAILLSSFSLGVLIYNQARSSLGSLLLFLGVLSGGFLYEYLYRNVTGRRIHEYVDENLEKRIKLIDEWRIWVPPFISELKKLTGEAKFYLIGSIARGEKAISHDIDILVVMEKKPSEKKQRILVNNAINNAGLTSLHPIHIHFASKEEEEEYKSRSKKYRKLD